MAEADEKRIKNKDEETKPTDDGVAEALKAQSETTVAAKAGKRSAKALKEKAANEAKQQRRQTNNPEIKAPQQTGNPPRSRLERAGKKFQAAAKHFDKTKTYPLSEAIDILPKTSPVKFDATVELHVNLGVDPKQADQNVRDSLVLPAGTGKQIKIAAYVEGEDVDKAKKAGAEIAGSEEVQALLEKEQIDFDVLISTPQMMPRLSKYARFLGPRGLMPNPKSGTVTADVAKAVVEARAGRVEYRVDSSGIVHLAIGKVSFASDKLMQNAEAALASIKSARPASLKGVYIKSVFLTTTMGPSIKVENP